MTAARSSIVHAIETYLARYASFSNPDYPFVVALWVVGTYLFSHFDAFPYLVITSDTKRSGKSRLGVDLMGFLAHNPQNITGVTAASVYRLIADDNPPTIIIDEAETLSRESESNTRAVLNAGYRRGSTVPRMNASGELEHWPVYCPKVFILIGDVYDTLRDRSIPIRMHRATPRERFVWNAAQGEGREIAARVALAVKERDSDAAVAYARHQGLAFLTDRDEEIWTPLAVVCALFAPDRLAELHRVAVDVATEKTAPAHRHVELKDAEADATNAEYAERLLSDMVTVTGGDSQLYSADAIERLHAIPTAPWRKFRGTGLTAIDLGNIMERFDVHPKMIRTGSKKNNARVARGYRLTDLVRAQQSIGR